MTALLQRANDEAVAVRAHYPARYVLFAALPGTDFPSRHAGEQSDALRAMTLPPGALEAVLWGNAHRLLPQLPRAS